MYNKLKEFQEMKINLTFKLFYLITFLALSLTIYGQTTPEVSIPLNFSDNTGGTFNDVVFFGLDQTATSGLDPLLGEDALPPFSPALEVRQNIGLAQSYKDYRNAPSYPFSGTEIHNLVWQLNPGATDLNIVYDLPANMTIQIQDNITGTLFNSGVVSGSGTYTITIASVITSGKLTAVYTNFSPELLGPTNLQAVADTFAVLLNWIDNSSNELGFIIERKNDDSLSVDPYIVIDSVGANLQSFNDTGRIPNTTYTYRVRAYNSASLSSYSNQVTATTIIPVELTSFTATVEKTKITLKWSTATELNNRGFEIERKLFNEWVRLIFIEGNGTTTNSSDYSYIDDFSNSSYKGQILYRLKQIDFDGTSTFSNVVSSSVDFTVKEYSLLNNFPNPFNPSTIISYQLPVASNVSLKIYNVVGEEVATLVNMNQEAGLYQVNFNADNLGSGIYFYKLQAVNALSKNGTNFAQTKKMILIR
jgi:hypothetical protein